MTTVRLVGYNVRSMRDDPEAIARILRGLRPDILCVQEAPRFGRWRRGRNLLASGAGLAPVVGERAAGLELCTGPHVMVLHREHHLLAREPGLHRRGLALAVLEIGGARLIAASVHLDLASAPRLRHVEELVARLERVHAEFRAPVVVAGDVNEEPGGAAWGLLAGHFRDAYAAAPHGQAMTFSSSRPRRRIDGVFAGPGIEVVRCGVPDDPELLADYPRATDHRPVLAELRLKA
jgi:endonuclease/exonuclease/phosphatase family metal-dependent hydrolase